MRNATAVISAFRSCERERVVISPLATSTRSPDRELEAEKIADVGAGLPRDKIVTIAVAILSRGKPAPTVSTERSMNVFAQSVTLAATLIKATHKQARWPTADSNANDMESRVPR